MSNCIFHVMKVNCGKLLLFFATIAIYFLLSNHEKHMTVTSTVLKCAPIFSLAIFIMLKYPDLLQQDAYRRKIFIGLIFSSIGDALLNWNFFPHGMASFAVAQVSYSLAFSFKPLKLPVGLFLYSFGVVGCLLFQKNLSGVLLFGLPIYSLLLLTMCWRSIARVQSLKTTDDIIRLLCAVGSVLFVVSDAIIGFNLFYSKVPNAQILIMVTYYIAQFFITFSILDTAYDKKQSHKSQLNYNGNGVTHTDYKQPINYAKQK